MGKVELSRHALLKRGSESQYDMGALAATQGALKEADVVETTSRREFCAKLAGLPLLAGVFGMEVARAEEPALPTYRCRKVAPFKVDGNLVKPAWRNARAVRLAPATGKAQKLQPTIFRACWSDTHLYAAFHCVDKNIQCTFTQRDEALYEEDVVEAFLCPDSNLHRYFELEFSPRNVIFDARVENPDLTQNSIQVDTKWNCPGLESAVVVHGAIGDTAKSDESWTMEVAIPFAGLELASPKVGERWRANFYRIDYGGETEFSAWSPTLKTPASYHVPKRFGWLVFEKGPA